MKSTLLYRLIVWKLILCGGSLWAVAPANDAFTAAQELTTSVGVQGSTVEATAEPTLDFSSAGETSTVWYRWTGAAGYHAVHLAWDSIATPYSSLYVRVAVQELDGSLSMIADQSFHEFTSPLQHREARFLATAGTEYWVLVSSGPYGEAPFSVAVNPIITRPPGDDFASAPFLTGNTETINVRNATREPDEPRAGYTFSDTEYPGSVWRRWTAPVAGYFMLTASSGDIVQAFRGTAFPLTSAMVGHSGPSSYSVPPYLMGPPVTDPGYDRITVLASAGETLYLRLGTDEAATGSITVSAATPGDHFASPLDAGNATQWNFPLAYGGYTTESGEPPGGNDLDGTTWVSWTAPEDAIFEFLVSRTLPPDLIASGLSPRGLIYQGSALDALTSVPSYAGQSYETLPIQFQAHTGQNYRFKAGITPLYASNAVVFRSVTDFSVSMRRVGLPPANDNFAQAGDLGNGPITVTGTNVAASSEPNEIYSGGGDTVWHRWTAPSDGGSWELIVTTEAQLTVDRSPGPITGDAEVTTVSYFASNFAGGRGPLRMRWTATPGQVTYFRLHGRGYLEQNTYTLQLRRMSPPANDLPANASVLNGPLPLVGNGTTVDASTESGDLPSGYYGSVPTATVHWKWIAPADGWIKAATDRGTLGVKENGYILGNTGDSRSSFHLRVVAGNTYWFQVATTLENEGPVSLRLEEIFGYEHSTSDTAVALPAGARVSSPLVSVNTAWAIGGGGSIPGGAWFRWTAPHSGWFSFDTEGSSVSTRLILYNSGASWQLAENQLYPTHFPAYQSQADVSVARILFQLTAGEVYYLQAASGYYETESGVVQVNVQPAGPPPTLGNVTIRPLSTSLNQPRMVEVLVDVVAPNGFSSGSRSAFYFSPLIPTAVALASPVSRLFTDEQRISGDAYAGTYRFTLELPRDTAAVLNNALGISLADHRGGQVGTNDAARFTDLPVANPDTPPPVLESISGLGQTLLLTDNPSLLTVRMVISDRGGSGFQEGALFLEETSSYGVFITGDSARQLPLTKFNAAQRISGDAFDGMYEVTLPIPGHLPEGLAVKYWMRDAAGNQPTNTVYVGNFSDVNTPVPMVIGNVMPTGTSLAYSSTSAITLPTVVTSGLGNPAITTDSIPPAITELVAALDSISQPQGDPLILTTMHLTDALSGFDHGEIQLLDANGVLETTARFDASQRLTGDIFDGTYAVSFAIPPHGFGGRHILKVLAYDRSGMRGTAMSNTIILSDRTTSDQRPPQLSYLQISPSEVDLRTAPAAIHVVLGGSDDRPNLTAKLSIRDSAGLLLATKEILCATPVIACDFDLTLPQRSYLGPDLNAKISIELTDSAGRTQTYGNLTSPVWPGVAPSLTIQPAIPDLVSQWASQFPDYHFPAGHYYIDTDGDGVLDVIEFALGTDPTLRSVSPGTEVNLSTSLLNLTVPEVNYAASGVDPRSHRLPRYTYSSLDLANLGGMPQGSYTYLPAPMTETSAWLSTYSLTVEMSTNLTLWNPPPVQSTTSNGGRITHTIEATTASQWFRLNVGGFVGVPAPK